MVHVYLVELRRTLMEGKNKNKKPKNNNNKKKKTQDIAAQVLSFHLSDSKRGIVAEEIWANP